VNNLDLILVLLSIIIIVSLLVRSIYKKQIEKIDGSEKYLQNVFDVMPNIIIINNGHEIDKTNPAMLEFFGYKRLEDFKNEHSCVSDFFLVEEECLGAVVNSATWLEYILNSQEKLHNVCMKKGGKKHYFLVSAEFMSVDEKERSLVLFTDISEQKELEMQLTNAKLEFDLFMHFIPANILIKDEEGKIVYANDSANKFFNQESIIGKSAKELLPFNIANKVQEFDEKVLRDGKFEEISEFYNVQDALIVVRTLGFKIERQESNQIGLVILDITQSYLDKKELKNKEEIIIAQSRLAAMGEMISMIAHQWRQPISVIAMDANNILADIELEMLDEETLKSGSLDILQQTQELSKTIDDFRNFFKPEQNAVSVFVEDVFKDAFSVMGKSLQNNSISVDMDIKNGTEIITFSRELMQVFINILQNAKDALLEKKPKDKKISITIRDNKNGVSIKICDNAGGIKEDILGKIFDPYFSTKSEKNGTGLGLYMSKTIIERHLYGTLTAENIENGVCFEIQLPKTIQNRIAND